MARHWLKLIGMIALLVLGGFADADLPTPKPQEKPPWQRQLQGDDAKQARELKQRINQLVGKGEFKQAVELARELLALRQRVQGNDHWETTTQRWDVKVLQRRAEFTLNQQEEYRRAKRDARMAQALKANGRHTEAYPLREQGLAVQRKLLGEEHPDTATAYLNLAANQHAQGKYAEAERGYTKALELFRKLLGEEHPSIATAYNGLALNQNAQGKYAEAERGFIKALELRRKLLGEDHPDTASAYNNLAMNQKAQGKYAEAERGYTKALELCRKLLGEEHPSTATAYNGLAANQNAQGKYAEAERGFIKALELRRKLLGEDHPDTAAAYSSLAANQNAQGKYAEAERGFIKALELRRKLLGEEHRYTASAYNSLAANQNAQGKYAEAERGLTNALQLFRKLLGEEHPSTATAYLNLAVNQSAQRKYAEAERGLTKALELRRKLLGEDHPHTATAYHNLAGNQAAQGKYAEAERGFTKALELRRKLLGEEHPDTATAYLNLANNQHAQGKYAEAERGYTKALELRRKLLGEEHPSTASAYFSVAINLEAQIRFANTLEAQKLSNKALENLVHAAEALTHSRSRLANAALDRALARQSAEPLQLLAALLAKQDKADLASQRFEQSLGRGALEELQARLARSPEDQAQLAGLERQLERLDQQLERQVRLPKSTEHKQILTQRRQVQDQLDDINRKLSQQLGLADPGQSRSLAQVQGALPADTALLGWVDFQALGKAGEDVNERWVVLVRSKGQPIWAPLKGSGSKQAWTTADSQLSEKVLSALRSRPGIDTPDWRDLARSLHRQRLEPLTAYLKEIRHVIVLPSAMMDGVPLEVLTDRHVFSRVSSATLFTMLRQKAKPAGSGVLVVADPVFERPDPGKPKPLPLGGLLLTAVVPGSNAHKAGLRAGNVLLRYRDKPLQTAEDLKKLIGEPATDPKARITVQAWRDGETFDAELLPGPLGVSLANIPAPQALAERRRIEADLASRGDGPWKSLPGTRIEAEVIARRFQQARQPRTLLTDSDASEQRLAALAADGSLAKARYLHLASHAEVNRYFHLQSAVILSRDNLPDPDKQLVAGLPVYDGRLTAAEVLRDWTLDAELVTLSACDTGLGNYAVGEGFIGFAQALLSVGSRSVCLSLWQVDDTATALLMDRFYANLLGQREGLKTGMGKAEALAEAKVWLRTLPRAEAVKLAAKLTGGVERGKGRPALPLKPKVAETTKEDEPPYAHPYYWAAFVLIGDKD